MIPKKAKLFLMFFTFAFVITTAELANASPTPTIAIQPAEVKDVSAGGSFKVNVTVTDAVNIYGWQVNVTFNPTILNVDSTEEGPFLKQVNTTLTMKKIDNNRGFLLYSSFLMPPYPPHGVDGSGLLMMITFAVKGSGESALHLYLKEQGAIGGTYLQTLVPPDTPVQITDLTTVDGTFRNASGGIGAEIPLEWVAGIVVVAAGGVGAAFMLMRRRKGKTG